MSDGARQAVRFGVATVGIYQAADLARRGIGASVRATVDFDRAMRNVNSIAQLSEGRFQRLSQSVLKLAGPTAQAPGTLAAGLYDLVSSGFDASESLSILRASAKAATAGLTTTEVSTAAVAAVLNAYKRPASDAQEVSDVLFRTVDRGVISFESLAGSIGNVLGPAAQLGIPIEDVGASIATMTKQGFSGEESVVRLAQAMIAFLKPSAGMKAAFKELGVASGEELIRQKGLQGAIEAVRNSTDGSATATSKLFQEKRALQAVLALTGKNAKGAAKDIDGLRDSTGATDRALSQQSKSIAFKWDRLKARISAAVIRIGTDIAGILTDPNLTNQQKFDRIADMIEGAFEKAFVGATEAAVRFAPRIASALARGFIQAPALVQLLAGVWLIARSRKLLAAFGLVGRDAGKAFAAGAATTATTGLAPVLAGGALGGAAGAGAGVARHTRALQLIYGPEARSGAPVSQLGAAGGLGGLAAKMKGFVKTAGFVGVGVAAADAILGSLDDRLGEGSDDLNKRIESLADVSVGERLKEQFSSVEAFFGTGRPAEADRAKRLKEILDQIKNSRMGITAEAAREATQLARNLNLTRQQRLEVQRALDLGRVKAAPGGALAGVVAQLKETGRLTPALINQISAQLEDLPRKTRPKFAQAVLDWATELKRQGKIKGSLRDLKAVIEAEVDGVGSLSIQGPRRLKDRMGAGFDAMVEAVARPTSRMAQIVRTYLDAFGASGIDKISAAIAKDKATRAKGHRGGLAQGGFLHGAGRKDTIPIMAAPGEAVLNRHQQEPVETALRSTYGYGLEDLFRREKRPHYMARGGIVDKFARGGIVALGRRLQKRGFDVGEHPAFGGVTGDHVPKSQHYQANALDINADSFPGGEAPALDRLASQLRRQGWFVIWRAPGHYDHLHVDGREGGGLRGIGGAPRSPSWDASASRAAGARSATSPRVPQTRSQTPLRGPWSALRRSSAPWIPAVAARRSRAPTTSPRSSACGCERGATPRRRTSWRRLPLPSRAATRVRRDP
jgi:TP901 family phage tail tape measure protein